MRSHTNIKNPEKPIVNQAAGKALLPPVRLMKKYIFDITK